MYSEQQYMDADADFERAESRRWKREMADPVDTAVCPACADTALPKPCSLCDGEGELALPPGDLEPFADELLDRCEECGTPSENLLVVEERDDEVGYFATSALCYSCRTAGRRADAEAEGGLIPGALALLGVDENWEPLSDLPARKTPARAVVVETEKGGVYGD